MVDIVNQNDKTICLNMIVKNESHIIASTLKNILEHVKIDYWVISDTGSTDDTVDIIQEFFKERNIDGELFQDGWKDFGTNRSKALEHAYNKSDYIFIFDADDLIHGQIALPIHFDKDMYQLPFENPTSYYRSVLISNRMRWKYNGVLHEMLANIDPIKSEEFLLGNFYIQSRRLGNRSKNPNKYIDDAVILANAYQNETTIFMGLADTVSFTISANMHSGAEVCNYPWDTWSTLTADDNWWEYVSHEYADSCQANSGNGYFELPALHQLMIGGFMFGMVFMATDPVTAAHTNAGKFVYGFLGGFLGILIRMVNPAYPEGIMLAILIANVFAPLIDHVVIQSNINKRLKRLKTA